jgi:hypothetical protein
MSTSSHDSHTTGRDTKAAFLGLIVGAIVLLAVLTTIVKLTAGKYAGESPAAEATK